MRVALALFLLALTTSAWADSFEISTPAFAAGAPIPARFSFHGGNLSPELRIAGVPANTKALLLIVDDPDAPAGLWTHWLVANIPVNTRVIPEGKAPAGAIIGKNSNGNVRYDGPKPPSGTHRYFFHLYALNRVLQVSAGFSRDAVEPKSPLDSGHPLPPGTIASCELLGTFAAHP